MATMDFEACYAALELPFGAGLKEVNERWRKLSRIHHPDRHARNPKSYHVALEKQKQLNNARDLLKAWYEKNPHAAPPRSTSASAQSHQQSQASGANSSTNKNTGNSHTKNADSQQKQGTQNHQHQSQTHSHQWQSTGRQQGSSSSQRTTRGPNTGWFAGSDLKLSPLQELVLKIDRQCSAEQPGIAIMLAFAALFGPLWAMSATLGAIFPELPGHYPDWLSLSMLIASGWCTCYIFRWFFAEAEIIKLQQKEMYFKSSRTIGDTVDLAKGIIRTHTISNSTWNFVASGSAQEATLQFEEEVFPEVKRSRCLKIRFEARPGEYSVVFAIQIKATSPVNSFSCKQIAEKVVADLKKELHPLAA